jgi:hypothetical protein
MRTNKLKKEEFMKDIKFIVGIVLIFFVAVFIIACSGGDSAAPAAAAAAAPAPSTPATQIQVSGTVDNGTYIIAAKSSSVYLAKVLSIIGFATTANAGGGSPTVDKIVAIPMLNGYLGGSWPCMLNSQSATINATDGTFTLALTKDYDWLLMLINSSFTGPGRFVGAVTANIGSSNSLMNLPMTDSTKTTMPLGTISRPSPTSGDALTGNTVGTADFNLTANQLTSIAKTGQLFRNGMNLINNYGAFGNGTEVWYTMRPNFWWYGDYTTLTSAFSDPTLLSYQGMNFQIDTNSTAVNMDGICSGSTIVTLTPPSSITMGGNTYDPTHPISTAGAVCESLNSGRQTTGSDLYADDSYGSHVSGPPLTYSVEAYFAPTTIPSGFWNWKENGVLKASFDIADVNPPILATGQPMGFVPSYRINVDGSNKITSVDIQWFYYDTSTSTWKGPLAPADIKVLKHFIGQVEVSFRRNYGGNQQNEDIYVDPATTNVVPTKTWYYGLHGTNPIQEVEVLEGFYETGGFGYYFMFYNPTLTP